MRFPKRVSQHISETSSFKLFSSKIPDSWIIRELSERDYGIDCYLELVSENNELTGDLVLIQLKAKQKIIWSKDNSVTLSGINIATSNYWYNFPVPVFLFLIDLENKELFYLPINRFIKKNYGEFEKQSKFNYKLNRKNKFTKISFKNQYVVEKFRPQFENEFIFFLSNLNHFQEFQKKQVNHEMKYTGIEYNEIVFFESMHRNYVFLCRYFNIKNSIPNISEIKKGSLIRCPSRLYDLYEFDIVQYNEKYQKLTIQLIKKIKKFLNRESDYWSCTNRTIYNYIKMM